MNEPTTKDREGLKSLFRLFLYFIPLIFLIIIFPNNKSEVFYFYQATIVIAGLLVISKYTRFKLLLRIISVFLFLNFILFPIIYYYTIKLDRDSFYAENTIISYIKKNQLEDAKNEFDIQNNQKRLQYVNQVLETKDKNLSLNFSILKNRNLCKIDTFYIEIREDEFRGEVPYSSLVIYGLYGERLVSIPDVGHKFGEELPNFSKIKDYLLANKELTKQNINNYSNVNSSLNKNEIWDFFTVLKYSLYFNLKPQSGIANIIAWLHDYILPTIFLGIFTACIYEIMKRNKKTDAPL